MKRIWGSGGIAPPFLTSALDGGEWSASRPGRYTPEERAPPLYPLARRLGGSQSGSGRCEEKKNLPLLGIEHLPSSPQPVVTPSDLSRLIILLYKTILFLYDLRFIQRWLWRRLKMEATFSLETSIDFYRTTRRYIPQDRTPKFKFY
jgi:hypothetical protein